MPVLKHESTGARIAAYRKLRGFTQRGLARQACVSYSLLTKVESGHRPATPALIAACARALSVTSFDLTGQPYLAELRRDRIEELIQPIRAALDNWDLALEWEVRPRSIADLEVDVRRAMVHRRNAQYGSMAQTLPALIDELVQAAQESATPEDRAHLYSLMGDVYRCVHTLAYKLGLIDLGTVALERMAWCAPLSDDPYLSALRSFLRVQSTFTTGRHDVGLRLVEVTQAQLQESGLDDGRSAALTGALHLQAAVLAARRHDSQGASERIHAARELAQRTGELPHYGLSWGPTNVVVHAVSTAVDLERPDDAIAEGDPLTFPPDWPRSREGHHWIDMSRAYLWKGRHDKALECLNKARAAAPQQARYHPSVRETVEALVRHRRTVPGSLTAFASWVGM
ncbi:helix-turn-helix domain-containing protein [Embleya sp. NPDC050493]|uniref:helix-turn-helix domain-containing protein n=1 Tax=Embleya sp. NPDC050493 TaxID=3363989 RepID=UPI00378FAC62